MFLRMLQTRSDLRAEYIAGEYYVEIPLSGSPVIATIYRGVNVLYQLQCSVKEHDLSRRVKRRRALVLDASGNLIGRISLAKGKAC